MVVPRSSQELAKDDEFSLFAVTVFKKHSAEFVHKCREKRWTPREWKFTEGGREAEEREQQKLEKDERRVWGEALRLGRTGYSDAVMAWIHVLALRVFVETVLRYGLPLNFVCGLVKVRIQKAITTKAVLTNRCRQLTSKPTGPKRTSTAPTHTSEAMLLVVTRRAGWQRMMPKSPVTCKRPAMLVPRTTAHMSFISLRLLKHGVARHVSNQTSFSAHVFSASDFLDFCFLVFINVYRHFLYPAKCRRLSVHKKTAVFWSSSQPHVMLYANRKEKKKRQNMSSNRKK